MIVVDEGVAAVRGCWLFGWGAPPPRAYPARIASLARAPFAVRKGRGWCWSIWVEFAQDLANGVEDAFDVCCDFVVPEAGYFVASAV